MGKISPVSAKYIVHAIIKIEGIVDKPDVIGAIFGQTEGLLGTDLELRELQKNGRIGRIEVNVDTKKGKSEGEIIIPSSLDKEETVIMAAALETIQRIGPCNAHVKVEKIEDVRISKRNHIIERAKVLLKKIHEDVLPDSREITEEVAHSVRMMGITEYGKDKLPASMNIDDAEEIIIVEGRADVLNLLKHNFKNIIAMNGTSVPQTIIDLSKEKIVTLFVDGDRGGDLIIKEVGGVADLDFVIKAPDGKEVEELTRKELHKALRAKVAYEQIMPEIKDIKSKSVEQSKTKYTPRDSSRSKSYTKPLKGRERSSYNSKYSSNENKRTSSNVKKVLTKDQLATLKQLLDDLIGTRGAFILDANFNVLGKVPVTELVSTIKGLNTGMFAVIFDGKLTKDILYAAEKADIKVIAAMDSEVDKVRAKLKVYTTKDF